MKLNSLVRLKIEFECQGGGVEDSPQICIFGGYNLLFRFFWGGGVYNGKDRLDLDPH